MSMEWAVIISALSLAFAVYSGISNMKRNRTADDKEDATQITTVIVKLENISSGIHDIKSDIRNVKDELKELRERVIRAEDSAKSAHRRIDEIMSLLKGGMTDG